LVTLAVQSNRFKHFVKSAHLLLLWLYPYANLGGRSHLTKTSQTKNNMETLSINLSPFTVRYPFTFIRDSRLMANGKYMVNGQWKMVNEASKGGA
jgi:hypothetical protein